MISREWLLYITLNWCIAHTSSTISPSGNQHYGTFGERVDIRPNNILIRSIPKNYSLNRSQLLTLLFKFRFLSHTSTYNRPVLNNVPFFGDERIHRENYGLAR
ncbi:hypothetical protein K435DRAFT_798421 [Dendrothele bispora CBS 962.96]|uniref:Protein kinase domain-containing protein n=1 Tax=Dendrothele bispora (strain CBS 962.96) TaxID=1314807 RepID=A0A4V4HFI5_DENBC|nr:hypothetical protein K435DRAFT_798421 [Dendrothele bispora CBS 962.96]